MVAQTAVCSSACASSAVRMISPAAYRDPAATEARPPVTAGAVLDAALTLFAERGYHGTAVSQIAAHLGIRTPSLYNHMRSKQELLETVIGRTVDDVLDDGLPSMA
jgi:AcrR family transcriptional regulator